MASSEFLTVKFFGGLEEYLYEPTKTLNVDRKYAQNLHELLQHLSDSQLKPEARQYLLSPHHEGRLRSGILVLYDGVDSEVYSDSEAGKYSKPLGTVRQVDLISTLHGG